MKNPGMISSEELCFIKEIFINKTFYRSVFMHTFAGMCVFVVKYSIEDRYMYLSRTSPE